MSTHIQFGRNGFPAKFQQNEFNSNTFEYVAVFSFN